MRLTDIKVPKDALELTQMRGADEDVLTHLLKTRKLKLSFCGKYVEKLVIELSRKVLKEIDVYKFTTRDAPMITVKDWKVIYAPREKALYMTWSWETAHGELRSDYKLDFNLVGHKMGFNTVKLVMRDGDAIDLTSLVPVDKSLFAWRP